MSTITKRRVAAPQFSVAEARRVVQDLFQPSATIYWTDFLASLSIGGACFLGSRWVHVWLGLGPLVWLLQALLFAITAVAFYRAALFTHELTHLPSKGFTAFRVAWNGLFGIPFLLPSFLYHTHVAHHRRQHYATIEDGEYLPFAKAPPVEMLKYLAQSLVIPLLAVVRFLVITPLSWIVPPFRRLVQQRASSMIIDPAYVRPLPTKKEQKIWRLQEAACLMWLLMMIGLIATGILSWTLVPHAYAVAVCVLTLNAIRTLGAHRYRNLEGEMTFIEQYLDSVNYPHHPLVSEAWAPVGLRYHALHHLFPSMPYHALPAAHRRLTAYFPPSSPYQKTTSPGLGASLRELYRASRAWTQRRRR